MASTLRGRREGSTLPPGAPRGQQGNRRGSGTTKAAQTSQIPAPPPSVTALKGDDSPLTPIEDTPHPSKSKAGLADIASKIPSLTSLLQPPPSESSSALPSQAPSSVTGLNTSKESSPVGEKPASIFPNPASVINLNLSANEPQRLSEEQSAENALRAIRDLDASFYRVKAGALWIKGYANYKELKAEDVIDQGVRIDGSKARFQEALEEFEWLLEGLRAQDGGRANDPAWRADPTGVFLRALAGARTLSSLNIAWKGLVARLNAGLFVYAKYLARAYKAFDAWEGEPPSSPASTTASFHQQEKVKFALGAIPPKYWPGGINVEELPESEARDRLVNVEDERLAPVPERLKAAFPDREPEEDPQPRGTTAGANAEKGKQREMNDAEKKAQASQSQRESEKKRKLEDERTQRERARQEREREEEKRRKEQLRQVHKEQEDKRQQEERDRAERKRLEERRVERLRAENLLLDHKLRLERERTRRMEEDEELDELLDSSNLPPNEAFLHVMNTLTQRMQVEESVAWDAYEEAKKAREQRNEEIEQVEKEREFLAEERSSAMERLKQSIWDEHERRQKEEEDRRAARSQELEEERLQKLRERGMGDKRKRKEKDEDGEDGFPETPAPRGRRERGGRRTSVYSFFGHTTPATLPPPLNQQGAVEPKRGNERRRSGMVNIPAAFRGGPPPDGGDSSDDDNGDNGRPPPRGPGEGRNPPSDPSRSSRTPKKGNEHKPDTPHQTRRGDGGPPDDPDGGSSSAWTAPAPKPPQSAAPLYISPMLKSTITNNKPLATALGFWLWQRLSDGSSVEAWDWMQASAYNWIQGLVDGYLGRRWAFREGHKHRHESPLDYISRRLMYARFLGYAPQGSREELQLIVERVPPHWHHMLSTSTVNDADELKERVIEFENELLAGSRQDHADLESSVAAILKRHGVLNSQRSTPTRSAFRKVAFAAESKAKEDDSATDEDLPSLQEKENESDGEEDDQLEEMLASAYSIVQKRTPATPKKYPFKRRDDVKTKEKKQPPAPCFSCGSPYHWNKECPHREEYRARRAKEGYSTEPGEASREKAYDAAYAMIASSGFDEASLETTAGPSEESKSTNDAEERISEQEENEPDDDEVWINEVLYVNTPSVGTRIEVIEEEYWHEGGALPADHPHLMEYVGDEAAFAIQPDVDLSATPVEEQEAYAIPDVRPYGDKPVKLKSRINRPPGMVSVGTSVLSVRGKIGSLSEEEIDLRLDSCASLTLLSAQLYDRLRNPPPLRKGAKMKLWQLTSTSDPIRGYVRLPVFIEADDGTVLEAEIEAYVVENMTVPVLLGEDFQQAYEVAVDRKVDEGTKIQFRGEESCVTAASVNRTADFNKVAKVYRGEIPEKSYARKAHRAKLRRERRKRKKIEQEEEFTVRAAAKVRLPPQTVVRVPLRGPFEKGGEWIIEKTLLATSDDLHLAVPNTLISDESPCVPVANLSHTPKVIHAGEVIGKIAIPGDYFDTPKTGEEQKKFEKHAQMLGRICELQNSGAPGARDAESSGGSEERDSKTSPKRTAAFRMPDKTTYGAWSAGQRPAKRKFYMPDKETYSSWADGDKEEQDEYGPKTAAMPEMEEVSSSEFLKTLDVGALPDHLKDKALRMLQKHQRAFALDGRLGDYEAAARIRVKEGTNPIAVPMFGASPAKKASTRTTLRKPLSAPIAGSFSSSGYHSG
ncbi:hypothetical protein GGF50DRAFT_131891 [Schizophyllum commune]